MTTVIMALCKFGDGVDDSLKSSLEFVELEKVAEEGGRIMLMALSSLSLWLRYHQAEPVRRIVDV